MSGAMLSLAARTPPPSGGASLSIKAGDVLFASAGDEAVLQFNRAGTMQMYHLAGANDTSDWVTPKTGTVGDAYEIRCTLHSGTLTGGSALTGTWLQLNSNRYWSVFRASPGTSVANVTIEIRPFGGGAVLASATKNITHSY